MATAVEAVGAASHRSNHIGQGRTLRQGDTSQPVVVAGTSAQTTRVNGRSGAASGPDVLDFGRYEGWSLQQIAGSDPDYLTWLSRHSSGIRYRAKIEALLARTRPQPQAGADDFRRRR